VATDPAGALAFFLASTPVVSCSPLGSGNVNDTWLVTTAGKTRFVLQRLSRAVFPDPALIQDNLALVTDHLRDRVGRQRARFRIPELITAPNNSRSYLDPGGDCWRMLGYIDNSRTIERITTPDQAWEIGSGLGLFHRLLADLVPHRLHDPLPGFHHTPTYLAGYGQAGGKGAQRAPDCEAYIAGHSHESFINLLEPGRRSRALRSQVIHGDPKAANFLFSSNGSRVISLIDLDTVKPGLLLHDIGDCLRSCCNPLGEEARPDTVFFDPSLFRALLTGYCYRAGQLLGPGDRQLIVDSALLISFELGLRFYTDYLEGNRYFKVRTPEQNLFRARVQFGLARSIEEQYTLLKETCCRILASECKPRPGTGGAS